MFQQRSSRRNKKRESQNARTHDRRLLHRHGPLPLHRRHALRQEPRQRSLSPQTTPLPANASATATEPARERERHARILHRCLLPDHDPRPLRRHDGLLQRPRRRGIEFSSLLFLPQGRKEPVLLTPFGITFRQAIEQLDPIDRKLWFPPFSKAFSPPSREPRVISVPPPIREQASEDAKKSVSLKGTASAMPQMQVRTGRIGNTSQGRRMPCTPRFQRILPY